MNKALEGVNVVEFASNLAAAYAAMLLAEQGATATRIEPPGGAPDRGTPHFHVLNRSKSAVFSRLDSGGGLARTLIERADVVITGFGPTRLKAARLDYESLCVLNPGVIALNVPPLGNLGPDADLATDDDLAAAHGGITGSQWARSGDPIALTFPAASYSAGVLAAMAAVAALMAREEGSGQAVEVSLLAGAFSLQTGSIIRHEKMTTLYHGPQDPLGPIPVYRLFEASDGRYLFVACGNATFWGKFAIALERPDLVSDPRFENAPWGVAEEHRETLKDIVAAIIRTRTRQDWLRILRKADVPCAPVMSRQEFIDHPQVRALAMRQEVRDPTLGATVQMGVPVLLNATPGSIACPAAPLPSKGDDSAAGSRPMTPPGPRAASLRDSAQGPRKPPLSGVLVLDFASYIAGSYGPMILAQLGADVVKIESLAGDAFRNFGFGFLGWNQGKRGIALDLASPEGREIILGLARRADVVVENLRPGRMHRFGFDFETLKAENPRLIYMSVNGFGNRGPEHNQPGFDPLLQARSGVMAAQGGHHEHPVYLTCAICDYGAAMLSAFGCVLALRAREKTGRGQFCETSLLQSAMALQAGEFIFYDGRPDLEDGRVERRGRAALSRAYRCRDQQWLFVSLAEPQQWRALRADCAVGDVEWEIARREPADGAIARTLERYFEGLDRDAALAQLRRDGIPSAPVNLIDRLFDDAQVSANDLLIELTHSQWGSVKQTGMLMKFSRTPGRIERSAPLLGEHTAAVLAEYLGYDEPRVAALRARGVIR